MGGSEARHGVRALWQALGREGRRGEACGAAAGGVVRHDGLVRGVLCSVWCGSVVLPAVRGCLVSRGAGLYGGTWSGVVWDAAYSALGN